MCFFDFILKKPYVCLFTFFFFHSLERAVQTTAREKKFKTAAALAAAWTRYKKWCDEHTVKTRMVEGERERVIEQSRPLTYTIEGFCAYEKISRQAFHQTYSSNNDFSAVVECIREECEVDARQKFETGQLPSKLAGLWMARYGYASKPVNSDDKSDVPRFEDL